MSDGGGGGTLIILNDDHHIKDGGRPFKATTTNFLQVALFTSSSRKVTCIPQVTLYMMIII